MHRLAPRNEIPSPRVANIFRGDSRKYQLEYLANHPGRRPGEHYKNAEKGEESEEALT